MWLLLLEAGVALFLLVFIVWWTLPSKKKTVQPRQSQQLPPDGESKP